jgi:hypothetical protein
MGPLKMTRMLVAAALVASLTSMMWGPGAVAAEGHREGGRGHLSKESEGMTWQQAIELIVAAVRELRFYDSGKESGIFMR